MPQCSRHVALLRGVNNVGKASRVAMADLRALFEGLGLRDVRTVLNSGNVVFTAGSRRGDLHARIAKALAATIGFTSSLILLTSEEVVAIVRDNPLARVANDPSRLLVVVPKAASDLDLLRPLLKKRWTPERLALGARAAYVWCADGVGASTLWPKVDHALNGTATARNIRTMTKLMALVQELPPAGSSHNQTR